MELTIDIAETTGFTFLGMMKSSCPVNGDVAFVSTESSRALYQHDYIDPNPWKWVRWLPIDPPADIEQYSNNPSNTGQSSPTLSESDGDTLSGSVYHIERRRTLVLFLHKGVHVAGGYSTQKLDVFIRVELSHFPFCCRFCALFFYTEDREVCWTMWVGVVSTAHENFHSLV